MCPDGTLRKTVHASVASSLFAHPSCPADYEQLRRYFESPELQLVTVTITEKGHGLTDAPGELTPAAREEMAAGPEVPKTSMDIVAAMLHARFVAGAAPIAMVTTDNFSQNGHKFRDSVTTVARGWLEVGKVDAAFVDYVSDERRVSFPWSMIERITPNPSSEVADKLASEGFADVELIKARGGAASSAWTTGARPSRPAPTRCWPSCRRTSPALPRRDRRGHHPRLCGSHPLQHRNLHREPLRPGHWREGRAHVRRRARWARHRSCHDREVRVTPSDTASTERNLAWK